MVISFEWGIKGREFIDLLSKCQLLKKDSALWRE
jgi:hypothetical protein